MKHQLSNSDYNYQDSRYPDQLPPGMVLYEGGKKRMISSLMLSLLVHAGVVLLVAATILILKFFGFDMSLFDPIQLKPRDMEFTLVENPTAPPKNKNTKLRAEKATRSGGQKVPKKRMAEQQRAAGAPQKSNKAPSRPSPRKQPTRAVTRPTPRPRPQPTPSPAAQQSAPAPKVETPAPTPPAPPSPKVPKQNTNHAPTPTLPPSPVAPAIKLPGAQSSPKPTATGPIASSSGGSSSGRSGSGSSGNPGPTAIAGGPSYKGAAGNPGSAGGGRPGGGAGGRNQSTQEGSPGGGGGRPGVDALPEPDYGPYIAELQRRIKRNWNPPTADRSKRVVARFSISRDGRLVSISIKQSSGSAPADAAALNAVRASAPFRPLPAGHKGNTIDVDFIFDYEVYSGKYR